MSLESKAKRFADLVIETNQKYGNSWENTKALIENQKWVRLEDAQKEISKLNVEFERNNVFSYRRIEVLSAKIEPSNKIVTLFPDSRKFEGTGEEPFDINEYLHQIAIWYKQLKAFLEIETKSPHK